MSEPSLKIHVVEGVTPISEDLVTEQKLQDVMESNTKIVSIFPMILSYSFIFTDSTIENIFGVGLFQGSFIVNVLAFQVTHEKKIFM